MRAEVGRKERDRLFQLSLDLLCIADHDGYFLDLNPAWERTLGWSRDALKSKPYLEFVHPDDRERTLEAAEALDRGEDVAEFENRYRTRDGSYRWLSWNSTLSDDGELIYAVAHDVTERRRRQERLARLAAVVESSTDAIMSLDRDGVIRTWNPGAEELFGYTAEEVVGEPISLLVPEDLEEETREVLARLQEGETVRDIETRRLRKDGEPIDIARTVSPIRDEEGEVTGFVGIARDIRRRIEAEEDLGFQKAVLEAADEASREGILLVDSDGDVLQYNDRLAEMWEIPDEVLEASLDDAVEYAAGRIENREEAVETAREYMESPRATGRDLIRIDSGEVFERYTAPVLSEEDEVLGRLWTFTDITDRKRAEEELRFRKALLEATNEASIDGILVVDEDGEMIEFNRRFVEMWGIPDEVLETRSDEAAISWVLDELEDPDAFLERIRYLYDHPEETSRDEIRLKDGRVFDRYSAPIRDPVGGRYGRVWFFHDITELKRTEEELERLARELKRSNESLERFAYVASHDLQEPLRMVSGAIEELVEDHTGDLDEEGRRLAGFAQEGAERMKDLIDDLLRLSRVEGTSRREPVDLEEVVDRVLEDLQVSIDENDAQVERGDLPVVEADRTQMRQLFQNLLGNALKFRGEDPPRIGIDARRRGDVWRIDVEDNGVGIEPGDRERIFGVFDRAHDRDVPGTGIGLALCKRIVERHDGELSVDSTPGEGSVFHVTLPVREASDG